MNLFAKVKRRKLLGEILEIQYDEVLLVSLIVIGSPHIQLLHNRCAITWVVNYRAGIQFELFVIGDL